MAADVLTTWYILSTGGVELNPVGIALLSLGGIAGLVAGKALVYTAFVISARLARHPAVLWRAALIVASVPVAWNLVQVLA
jgi:hypothetical protein